MNQRLEILNAMKWLWQIAYRNMPNDRHALDQISELIEQLMERHEEEGK